MGIRDRGRFRVCGISLALKEGNQKLTYKSTASCLILYIAQGKLASKLSAISGESCCWLVERFVSAFWVQKRSRGWDWPRTQKFLYEMIFVSLEGHKWPSRVKRLELPDELQYWSSLQFWSHFSAKYGAPREPPMKNTTTSRRRKHGNKSKKF